MNHSTGICYHCGAEISIHQYKHLFCPKNGREEWRDNYPQQWETTKFEDSGIKILELAAPELLEALKIAFNELKIADKQNQMRFNLANESGKKAWEKYADSMIVIENTIKKATTPITKYAI